MALLDGSMSRRALDRAYNTPTPGTSAMLGDAQFQQLLAAYNNRQPVRSMTSTGEGQFDYYTPDSATLNGYQIEAFGPNQDMYRVYQNLPEGSDQLDFDGKNFDIYSKGGQYVGTHQFQNMGGGPILNALDGFWDKAIPIATMAFIGGGFAGAAGYGPMAGGNAPVGGLDLGGGIGMGADGAITGATAMSPGGISGLSNAGIMEAVGAGGSAVGGGAGGFGSVGQVFGGSGGAGYNIPGLGSSLSGSASTPSNFGNLLKTLGVTGGGNGLSLGSLIGPAASLIGGYMSSKASGKAADAQLQAAREAMAMFEPWRNAGGWSIGQAATMLGKNGPEAAKNAFMASPDYQFRRDEGEKSLTRAAAAAGLRGSGKFLKDYTRFNQDLASTEYGNSLNRLLAVAGMGQTATNSTADYRTQAANAQAAGAVGSANAWTNALSQGASMYNNYQQQQQNNALLMAAILSGRA